MKRIISMLLCTIMILASFTVVYAADNEYSLTSGDYVRLLGRGEMLGMEERTFNWPNAGFEFIFTGSSAEVYVEKTIIPKTPYNGNFFNCAVFDGDVLVRVERLKLTEGWNTIYTEQAGDPEVKKIMLVRSSEGCFGLLSMSKLKTDSAPVASAPRDILIEFIGDSYTAGYGNSINLSDNKTTGCAENTDNWNSYTGFVARNYRADYNVLAYQGIGLYRQGPLKGEGSGNMMEQFEYADTLIRDPLINMTTKHPHDFSKYQPNLVTVWLGTNDRAIVSNEEFKPAYSEFLTTIKSKYPDAKVLCMALSGSKYHDDIADIVASYNNDGVYMLTLNNFTSQTCDHPDIEEDKRIANQIIEKLDSIEGLWDKPVKTKQDTNSISFRVDYNKNTVDVIGKTTSANDNISAFVLKPGVSTEDFTDDDIVYAGQSVTTKNGEYKFSFKTDKLSGKYSYFMNTQNADNYIDSEFYFENFVPEITVFKKGEKITSMSELSTGDILDVRLSGFDVSDEFSGMMAIAQYKEERLCNLTCIDISDDTYAYNDIERNTAVVGNNIDSIKIIYVNNSNFSPMIGAYTID